MKFIKSIFRGGLFCTKKRIKSIGFTYKAHAEIINTFINDFNSKLKEY